MFLQQIEEFVNLSVVGTPAQKVQASQYVPSIFVLVTQYELNLTVCCM